MGRCEYFAGVRAKKHTTRSVTKEGGLDQNSWLRMKRLKSIHAQSSLSL